MDPDGESWNIPSRSIQVTPDLPETAVVLPGGMNADRRAEDMAQCTSMVPAMPSRKPQMAPIAGKLTLLLCAFGAMSSKIR